MRSMIRLGLAALALTLSPLAPTFADSPEQRHPSDLEDTGTANDEPRGSEETKNTDPNTDESKDSANKSEETGSGSGEPEMGNQTD